MPFALPAASFWIGVPTIACSHAARGIHTLCSILSSITWGRCPLRTLRISPETIYRRIRWDKKAGGDLWRHTRIMSKFGRKRYRSHDSRGVLSASDPLVSGRLKLSGDNTSGIGKVTR